MMDTNIQSLKNWLIENQEYLHIQELWAPLYDSPGIAVKITWTAWDKVTKPEGHDFSQAFHDTQNRIKREIPSLVQPKNQIKIKEPLFPPRKRGRPKKVQ